MKSKATKTQAAQTAYSLPIKVSGQHRGPRSTKSPQPASNLKNEYTNDRMERGRSPTVRALIWKSDMTQVKPSASMPDHKKAPHVQHVEYAMAASELITARSQNP